MCIRDRHLPVPHCIEGTQGHALAGEIAALCEETDRCFRKNTFGSDALYEYLKKTPYERIEPVSYTHLRRKKHGAYEKNV